MKSLDHHRAIATSRIWLAAEVPALSVRCPLEASAHATQSRDLLFGSGELNLDAVELANVGAVQVGASVDITFQFLESMVALPKLGVSILQFDREASDLMVGLFEFGWGWNPDCDTPSHPCG